MWRSVSPTYLLSSSGPLMLRKNERPSRVPVTLGDLLGQRVRDRLGDQRLAAPGRAVEQDPLRRLELVLAEQVGVQVRQLDGVADLLDLRAEPADVARSRCPGPPRGRAPRPRPWGCARRRTASAARAAASRRRGSAVPSSGCGEPHDALLVGVPDDERALAVLEDLLEHHDLAVRARRREHATTFIASLSMTSWPGRSSLGVDVGAHDHAHLAAGGEDVDGCRRRTARGRRRSRSAARRGGRPPP